MIITEMLDDQQSSSERAFWGIKVLPKQPVTVRLPNNSFNCLHISQATAESSSSENMYSRYRSLVSVKCDGKNKILICSLGVYRTLMATLELEFTGPCEMVFSLKGQRGVHLVGHFYNRTTSLLNFVAPPIENERREWKGANKHYLLIADEIEGQNNASEKKRKCKEENKHLLTVEDIDANDNGSEEGRKQKVENTLPIIAADNDDGDPNEGSSVRRKLDYVLPVKEVQPLDSNDKEREKKQKKKREKKHLSKVDGAEGYNVEG